MRPLRVAFVLGTRPEAIKCAPLITHLSSNPSFEVLTILTGQHRELVDQVVRLFNLPITVNLKVMTHNQSLEGLAAALLERLAVTLAELRPDCVIVQGDTTSTWAGAQTAFYQGVRVAHLEAGLRTSTPRYPFPEEMNRRLTSVLADYHFAATNRARDNLLREGHDPARVWVTGNTGIDALRILVGRDDLKPGNELGQALSCCDGQVLTVTAHRRENLPYMAGIAEAIMVILREHPSLSVVFPVHLNPRVRQSIIPLLQDCPRCYLLSPLDYGDFVLLMKRSTLILTDSGGIQEEAPSLGIPVLVMRRETERPEAVEAGAARLVGESPEGIVKAVHHVLSQITTIPAGFRSDNPFGDGHASERIAVILEEQLNGRGAGAARG